MEREFVLKVFDANGVLYGEYSFTVRDLNRSSAAQALIEYLRESITEATP